VGTGDVGYHPLYMSIGNVHNNLRRGHRNAVVPIAFLAIPKGTLRYKLGLCDVDDTQFDTL
jgi:hypothetical protein